MRRIICYPHSSAPVHFDSDADYFELFSHTGASNANIRSLGLSLPRELRHYGITPPIATVDFAAFAFSVVASDKLVPRVDSPDGWTRMIDLKLKGTEGSTRARSIAFFAFALLASSAVSAPGEFAEIVVPENGFISLNVPLDSNRIGSLSTKTTHPVYMALLQEIWDALGIKARLILPYKHKTKGEVLKECRNRQLLEELVFESNSCGKFRRHGLRHCGVCVPCLVRRAAFLAAGIHDITQKGYHHADLSKSNSKDLAAVALAIKQVEISGINRLIKGNLSFAKTNDRDAYLGVVSRGINELNNFLKEHDLV